jgi:hypothetical protein
LDEVDSCRETIYFFDRWWGHPKAVAALQGARLKLQQSIA